MQGSSCPATKRRNKATKKSPLPSHLSECLPLSTTGAALFDQTNCEYHTISQFTNFDPNMASENANIVDETPLSPVRSLERRNSLEKHLQHRPEPQDLKNRHILLDTTTAPYVASPHHFLNLVPFHYSSPPTHVSVPLLTICCP